MRVKDEAIDKFASSSVDPNKPDDLVFVDPAVSVGLSGEDAAEYFFDMI